tara:strand:+ start:199 stop:585 length:387 start_codon:yes stop_codon:yes gene_type:complete
MARKLYDLSVKVGEYTNKAGETKGRWQNVGALMESDNGMFIMLAKWFNPAGVVDTRGGESILVSCFEPKPFGEGQQAEHRQPASAASAAQAVSAAVRHVPSAAATRAKQTALASKPALPVDGSDDVPF